MDGFTIVDGGVTVAIMMSALLAYSRGLVREIMAIAGWIAAAFIGFILADTAQPLVRQIPYLGDMLGDSCELLIVASFAIVFALSLLLVSLFTPLFSAIVQRSIFGGFDQMLGFFFGVARGAILVAVGFFIYFTVMPNQDIVALEASRSAAVFERYVDDVQDQNPEAALGWLRTQYDQLVGECSA
ncbi:MAG: CvpA family protein [Planktomarina sp.]|uniref:CvpA family protein n=1 Tax=Planktomarina sp. TaxID=2024851 RepID=UPI0028925940|nr:CvpA family protein [Planktomarina sp.]MDT2030820.1 CvpA family protein [Planktomarina sp.]MDT2071196.1 CvpA family protein [Planktomarina sp.]